MKVAVYPQGFSAARRELFGETAFKIDLPVKPGEQNKWSGLSGSCLAGKPGKTSRCFGKKGTGCLAAPVNRL